MRGHDHHRQIFVDQRVRAVLHLARGIAFGVDVGNFLQLQRAFERDGVMNAASQEKKIVGAMIFLGEVFGLLLAGKQRFQLGRNARQFVEQLASTSSASIVPRTCPRYTANRNSAVNCAVNALVEATPISGPACV